MTFLSELLEEEYDYSKILHDQALTELESFDNLVLNHAVKTTVCKIFFNLRLEPLFFKEQQVLNSLQILVKFVLKTNNMLSMTD